MLDRKITGIISGGLMGSDPFDPSSWSGSSLALFRQLQAQELLDGAYGADLNKIEFYARLACKFHPVREVWKRRLYMSTSYRNALTKTLATKIKDISTPNIILQLGAYINVREIYGKKATLVSYQDGNVAEKFKSDFTHPLLLKDKKLFKQVFEYEMKAAHDMDCVFTTSEYLRQSFIDDYKLPTEKVVNVKIGINLSEFEDVLNQPKDYSRQEILFIGKTEFTRKGGDLLINAFKKIRVKYPGAILHMVGIDRAPTADFDVPGVIYHGFLNKADAGDLKVFKKLLRDCSIFVLPTRFEPLGIAPIEAMIHKIPAVVTGEWALKENVIDGKTGLLTRNNDVDDIAEKIDSLFSSPEKLKQMGGQARDWTRSGFTWTDTVNRITTVLGSL